MKYGIMAAMKKDIKLKFIGFGSYHDPHQQPYFRFLQDRYNLIESDRPDYLIDAGQDFRHVKYDCVKIALNAENCVTSFDDYDYAIGSSELSFGDRYVRVPWFAFYPYFPEVMNRGGHDREELLNRKFCSFVVSNAEFGDPMRRLFFDRLSKYKKVDSGGRYKNNVGGPVADKIAFCRGYKFNIAFENSSFPGYTTEKIMEAYVSHAIPIYYGNPHVETDFLLPSMVQVKSPDDIERAVEEIIRLDCDDEAYLAKVTAPCLVESSPEVYEKRLEGFLAHIFDQPLDEARRICPYGHQAVTRRHLKYVRSLDQTLRDSRFFGLVAGASAKIRSWF